MRFDIITVFPEAFESYFSVSILNRAHKRKIISLKTHGLREWGKGKHKELDNKPYGGGAGMVLEAEPILKAVDNVLSETKNKKIKRKIILLSAKGKPFNQKLAYDWAYNFDQIVIIAGRYEGIDERVRLALRPEEVSIGPYVLTDGDIAAAAIVSAVARLVPGVIRLESLAEESHWNMLKKQEVKNLGKRGLEYPHYTRPDVFTYKGKKYRVPPVLLSGDHKKIAEWREKKSL